MMQCKNFEDFIENNPDYLYLPHFIQAKKGWEDGMSITKEMIYPLNGDSIYARAWNAAVESYTK